MKKELLIQLITVLLSLGITFQITVLLKFTEVL
jgi:hypothetical protein